MNKLNRERKLRERRIDKQARKDARRYALENPEAALNDGLESGDGEPAGPDAPSAAIGEATQAEPERHDQDTAGAPSPDPSRVAS